MESRLKPLAEKLEIQSLLDKYPYEVSGGQKQRAAAARALITQPKLLLADEPTGALDSRASGKLLELFDRVNEEGQTILMVTHSVRAAAHAGRVLFILTLTGMAAIFDIMGALAVSPALDFMLGGGFMREILLMGERIVGIFSLIFLFYTNSFLLKQQKKEFGLYHILGMEKRHVALILVLELFYTVLLGLGLGLLAGTVFYKAVLLLLCRILHAPRILGFEFSVSAFTETVVLFGMVFFLLAIYGVRQIFRSETTELLKSNQTAEREPKNRWFLVLVGLVSLGAGYYLAVTIESPLGAIAYFFLAVVLVIIGTYCLFTAGSIFILKMLKKNKGYYYQSRHFTSVSGMLLPNEAECGRACEHLYHVHGGDPHCIHDDLPLLSEWTTF